MGINPKTFLSSYTLMGLLCACCVAGFYPATVQAAPAKAHVIPVAHRPTPAKRVVVTRAPVKVLPARAVVRPRPAPIATNRRAMQQQALWQKAHAANARNVIIDRQRHIVWNIKKPVTPAITAKPQTVVSGDSGVIQNSKNQQGKMYRRGGANPSTGFDCSGLTQYAYRRGAGVALPRTAAAQYGASIRIPRSSARRGDLIFFHTRGRRVSHVGIYLGGGKFIHSPRPGKAVTTSSLDSYWSRHLIGFGRIPGVCNTASR